MNIGNILNKLDDRLGIWIFKNNNIFSYNLFSYFYEKNIINPHSDLIENYKKKGFYKGPKIKLNLIEKLKDLIKNQDIKKNTESFALFKWNKDLKEILEKIILNDLSKTILQLQEYYNAKIILTHARIQRNFGFEKKELDEKFSDNFHNDRWLFTYIKLFINLEDIDLDKGPTHIIPRDKSSDFVNVANYKSRKNYKNINYKQTYINTGNIGETLIFNSSICLHKAGNPNINQTRDMLMLQFSAIPSENNKSLEIDKLNIKIDEAALGEGDNLSYKHSRPYGFYTTLKLYKRFKKNLDYIKNIN